MKRNVGQAAVRPDVAQLTCSGYRKSRLLMNDQLMRSLYLYPSNIFWNLVSTPGLVVEKVVRSRRFLYSPFRRDRMNTTMKSGLTALAVVSCIISAVPASAQQRDR